MELPADPSPTVEAELEHLEKEQSLGEATNLGSPGFETENAIATAVESGSIKIAGKTAIPGDSQAATIPTAIPRGKTEISRGGQATTIQAAIRRGQTAAVAAPTPGGTAKGETSTGKT